MIAAYWVWRRELRVMLRAPIVYVVGGLFLIVQGIAFAGLVGALSDPRRPAPLGALLEGQLAGTLLTWVLQLVVITLLGMRAIADDRKDGGWELLLTAQVGERAAVVGKWAAAATVYALLWLPTLLYLAVVAGFRADSGGWDAATIACGYAGAIALGAALLAWTIAASAASSTTLGAGALGFALLVGLFLAGELPTAWPALATDHPAFAAALSAISLRAHLGALARGEIDLRTVVLVVGLAATGLSLAIALACAGRRRRREVRARFAATALVAAIAVLAGVLAADHPHQLDVSAAHRNTLDPETRAVLAELPAPATLTIVEPTLGALAPLYDEVARVADRMAEAAPVTVRRVDPAALPGGLPAAAREAGVQPADLASNGGVVVELAGKRRVVDRLQLADVDRGAGGAPEIERVAIEQAITGALAELADPVPLVACATTGHGELPIDRHAPNDADWTAVADRLRGEGATIQTIDLAQGIPAACQVVLVIGPTTPLSDREALAVQHFGGGVLVAAASRGSPGPTGLEGVLREHGLGLPPAIAIDPTLAVRELPGALLVLDGYADHPINAGFARTRATLWYQPRAVIAADGARPLVSASAASWGERDLVHGPPAKDADDLAGPVALAAAGKPPGRMIAIGSAESFATSIVTGGASAGDLWIARAVRWLAAEPEPRASAGARPATEVRLVMTDGERSAVIALCTGGIPLAWIALGGAFVAWRRRRAR
ncbi:MAG TPA: Gldg family protein [Kofleriaceae bacterium]|jgi:ABC-2 type transport system permease protein